MHTRICTTTYKFNEDSSNSQIFRHHIFCSHGLPGQLIQKQQPATLKALPAQQTRHLVTIVNFP